MTADEEICKGCEQWEKMCSSCNLKSVCSDSRKERHGSGCEDYEYLDRHAFYPGGSPPRTFCPVCKHKEDKCISSIDIEMYAGKYGYPVETVKKHILEDMGYVLSEYSMLEGQCMMRCDRFEEKE